jgi:pimeloyl-ACP methyl ester carboxylesterase
MEGGLGGLLRPSSEVTGHRLGTVPTPTVRRGSLRFAVRTFGRRGRHVVLIHGLASTQHIWDLVIPRLERRLRVVTYDQRGHGESSKPSTGYDFASVCADLGAVLRAVKTKRPVLVGHSYGANVAVDYAARHPRDVAGIVCVDGGMGSISEIMSWKDAKQMLAPPKLAGLPIDELLEMGRRGSLGHVWSPEVEAIVRSLFEADDRGRAKPRLARSNHMRILRAMYDQRPKELLAKIDVPVLMFCARPRAHGADEERGFYEMKKASVAQIRKANPKVKIEWIPSIHDIPLDRPRELADRIGRFATQEARA